MDPDIQLPKEKQFPRIIRQWGGKGATLIGQVFGNVYINLLTPKTALTILIFLTIVAGIAYYSYYLSQQPEYMTGDFNIAVAEFVQTGDGNGVAPIVSQRISGFLDGQYNQSSFEDVQVAHNRIGAIANAQEAKALAQKINAHLVIYGDVAVIDDQVLVTPQFYVVEVHQSDVGEVNGEHKLAARISFPKDDLVNTSEEALETMQQSAAILTEFTKALVYLTAGTPGDLKLAETSIKNAIAESEDYGPFEGKEILYLFASDIARRQKDLNTAQIYIEEAMHLNDNYGRAYIAQANIYYDQGNLYEAINHYEQAKKLTDQPFGAYITEKASLGIGNSCNVQYQHIRRNDEVDEMTATALANCALDNYQIVINSYSQQAKPEFSLKEMAALAHYGSGIIYQEADQSPDAQQAYENVLNLTQNSYLLSRAQSRLEKVKEK